jgi:hypothetical protein
MEPSCFEYLLTCAGKRADERTRTAFLLTTSDNSGVAGVCIGLQTPHIQAAFSALLCPMSQRIAFPVMSEWCQKSVSTRRRIPLKQTCDYCSIILFTKALGRCVLQSSQSLDPTGMRIPYLNQQLLQGSFRQDAHPRVGDDCISMNAENSQPIFDDQELDAK